MISRAREWAWRQELRPESKLVLLALADGIFPVEDIANATGLPVPRVMEAFAEIGRSMLVIWRARRPFFRLGEAYRDQDGRSIDGE